MKKAILFMGFLLLFAEFISAQEQEEEMGFIIAEEEPTFPGGIDSLMNFITQNLEYPEIARINKIEGRVFLTFMIEKDGSLSNIKILRDIGYGCGDAAIKVVEKMPKWNPAKLRGKTVGVQYNLPVTFSLKDLKKKQADNISEKVEEDESDLIFMKVDEEPSFPGGEEGLRNYLSENIKYSNVAKNGDIQGKVFVAFVVEKDGSLSNIRLIRDIGGGCGAEAVRVVKNMPKWIPGKQRGKAVRVQYNLPIVFALEDKSSK